MFFCNFYNLKLKHFSSDIWHSDDSFIVFFLYRNKNCVTYRVSSTLHTYIVPIYILTRILKYFENFVLNCLLLKISLKGDGSRVGRWYILFFLNVISFLFVLHINKNIDKYKSLYRSKRLNNCHLRIYVFTIYLGSSCTRLVEHRFSHPYVP